MNEDEFGQPGNEGGNLFAHLPAILKDRWLLVVVPAILVFAASVAAALVLPTVYRSTATLLVESPQLPDDVIGSASVDIIDQRIAKYRQQVLSRPKLIELDTSKNRLFSA